MWIQIRSIDGKKSIKVDGLSKLTKIEDLRLELVEPFDAPVEHQRLFYRGKQLEDGYTLFDYDVGLNDIIQIFIKLPAQDTPTTSTKISPSKVKESTKEPEADVCVDSEASTSKENSEKALSFITTGKSFKKTKYFKIDDLVDARDVESGGWFEAKIIGIEYTGGLEEFKESSKDSKGKIMKEIGNKKKSYIENGVNIMDLDDDLFLYYILFEGRDEEPSEPVSVNLDSVRPRARTKLKIEKISVGDKVMVNYNVDEPLDRGFWFDCEVTKISRNYVFGTIFLASDIPVHNCKIIFNDEIFAIEKKELLSKRKYEIESENGCFRKTKPNCSHCNDVASRKCKVCGCAICGGKNEPAKLILCDECNLPYHIWCLHPPLDAVPESDEWYCPSCKNDENEVVKAGEKLKASKKKSKMASFVNQTTRDWGKGMACVGRTKECKIVPPNHFGPIPGTEVGMMWMFRVQVSETGIHRPHVAGIHGRESEGAYSIVLSGGYEDDLDDGEEFKYTGSGGRDLSGNKRTADQSCDQTLTRMNKALALNCAAKLDSKKGATAANWKEGKPVRVVRNCKGRKHSKYAPEEGNRYDGIYKIVSYWPEKGKSGFLVWRYLLRRDDDTPAPWTKEGKKRIEELGFTMEYPEGYSKKPKKGEESDEEANSTKTKRKRSSSANKEKDTTPKKKAKSAYKLPQAVSKLIEEDTLNAKIWEVCKTHISEGSVQFLKEVECQFSCICCQEIAVDPITTECFHTICKECLKRSFKAEVYSCPMCRHDLGKGYAMKVNSTLGKVLCLLFPGYNAGR